MANSLHTYYRPNDFDEVFGQGNTVKALEKLVARDNSRAYLFSGPSGVGKTTLARIVIAKLGIDGAGIIEIDAADNTGVEDVRKIKEAMQYRAFNASGKRAILLDEAHRLSGNAWDALLKAIEEPPSHITWFFCTTNPAKVPQTIRTRCTSFDLKSVPDEDLNELLAGVCEAEKIKLTEDVATLIVRESRGSPRQMLVNLEICRDAKDKRAAADLLRTALDSDAVIKLCRFLLQGGTWPQAMALVKQLEKDNPEGVRIIVTNYMAKVLSSATSDKTAMKPLHILEQFSTPYNSAEKQAPLILSIGRALYAD